MSHLTTALKNPYLWILLVPLTVFVTMWINGVEADDISVTARIGVFFVLAYVAARYTSKAPQLMWRANVLAESRNIIGWAMFLLSQMMSQVLAILSISLSENGVRPAWLSVTYYAPAFVSLSLVGLLLVASSIPKFPMPPFFGPGRGMSGTASIIIALLSAGGLWLAAHFPLVAKFVTGLFVALTHAV